MLKSIIQEIYPLSQYNVILANGQYPNNAYLTDIIFGAQTLICCDGAINNLIRQQINPDYIIGDCDSISNEIKNAFQNKIIVIADQNSNDLTKAVNLSEELKLTDIVVLGATGMREDHTLANIGLLTTYAKQITNICLLSDYGIFTTHSGTETVKTLVGQQISFFTDIPGTKISAPQLKWPLTNYKLEHRFSGTLNEATQNYLTITTSANVILYRSFEIKMMN